MGTYTSIITPGKTPQNEPAKAEQVKNNAGGYVFALDRWKQLDRFLVLGTTGGTYYADERKHTMQAVGAIRECLDEDGPRFVRHVASFSDAGRAPKNDPAIFCLALAASHPDPLTRKVAFANVARVCRIPTHLFAFISELKDLRKWSRMARSGVARWYEEQPASNLAYAAVKYQAREGWSHRDVLRLAHPTPSTPEHDAVFRWMVGGAEGLVSGGKRRPSAIDIERVPAIIRAFERSKTASEKEVIALIREEHLPRECVPTAMLNSPEVWEALLEHMPITAMIRNLGKMSNVGLLKPLSNATKEVVQRLTDRGILKGGRVHPMTLLLALGTYRQGRGQKGALTWKPNASILGALDDAFHLAFEAVEPTGLNYLLGIDVSGSMGTSFAGGGISCREAAAALALVTTRIEPWTHSMAFCNSLVPFQIEKKERLSYIEARMSRMSFGATDCALPMLHASGAELDVDVFVVLTDNETWFGGIHPFQALQAYRAKMNKPNAALIVVGMTATGFTIADPSDARMLDIVGFDSAAPQVMADFVRV